MTATATLPPAPVFDAAVACQRCQASVVWVRTEANGKSMPLNPRPRPDGNVVMVPLAHSRHFVARVLPPEQLPPVDGSPTYLPHFATCAGGASRRPRSRSEFTKRCVRCGSDFAAATLKAVERVFDAHYREKHANQCWTCEAPVVWIRREGTGGRPGDVVMIDGAPVVEGDVIIVSAGGQAVARDLAPEDGPLSGYRIHPCPVPGGGGDA